MDFLKKHYEKILLTVVLLGSVGLLIAMPFFIEADRQDAENHNARIFARVTPLANLDMSAQEQLNNQLTSNFSLDLDTTNKLFNPLEWQKNLDGQLVRKQDIGEKAVVVSKITPLYFEMKLDRVETNELGSRYYIAIQRQAATKVSQQHNQRIVSVGDKNNIFQLLSIKGPAENPDQLVVKLMDSGETVTLYGTKPYQRVDGYSADLRYDPERKNFNARRVGSEISFAGEDYIIVAISQDEVILSAQSNQKRTKLQYTP